MLSLEMKHIGEIARVGDTHVFGLSRHVVDEHRTDTVYLNIAGPATSVEAVWAGIVEGRSTVFTDLNGRHHYIQHRGIDGQDGTPYRRFQRRIEGLAVDHLILLDRRFLDVDTDAEVSDAFVFEDADMDRKVGHLVREMVNIAVFDEWFGPLLAIGRRERLVVPVLNDAHRVFHVRLDRTRWEHLIALGVEHGVLLWPGSEDEPKTVEVLPLPEKEDAAPTVEKPLPPFTVSYDRGWTWFSFPQKPSDAVLEALKQAGFRWSRRRQAWYTQSTLESEAVERLLLA